MESKYDGVLEKVQRLERALSGVNSDATELQGKATQIKKGTDDMDVGLNNLNFKVAELWKKWQNCGEIKPTNDFCLYQTLFLGFPEATHTEEVTREVVYQFLESKLELDGVRDIESQCVH